MSCPVGARFAIDTMKDARAWCNEQGLSKGVKVARFIAVIPAHLFIASTAIPILAIYDLAMALFAFLAIDQSRTAALCFFRHTGSFMTDLVHIPLHLFAAICPPLGHPLALSCNWNICFNCSE